MGKPVACRWHVELSDPGGKGDGTGGRGRYAELFMHLCLYIIIIITFTFNNFHIFKHLFGEWLFSVTIYH